MKVARLVLGIITMVVAVISLIAGIGNAVNEDVLGYNFGSVQMILGFILLLPEGIVMVACSRKGVLGGCIACLAINIFGIMATAFAEADVTWLVVIYIILALFSLAGLLVSVLVKPKKLNQN